MEGAILLGSSSWRRRIIRGRSSSPAHQCRIFCLTCSHRSLENSIGFHLKPLSSIHIQIIGLQSGPIGGDAQIASRLVEGEIDAVIFFRDPLDKHPHEPDVNMLLRLCDVHNIPLATNYYSAKILVSYLRNKIDKKKQNSGGIFESDID